MAWDWLKRWFGRRGGADEAGGAEFPVVPLVAASESPWGVPLLDVRPVTLGLISTSGDPQCAANAISFAGDDGTSFIGVEPPFTREAPAGLRYRIDRVLPDGALFLPEVMEQKWALYLHRGRIICVRSWLRQVQAVADARVVGDWLEVSTIRGVLTAEDEDPGFTSRVLDFLIRSHALDMVYPAPLPAGMDQQPRQAALWCMSCFGNRAHFATSHPLSEGPPERPLRSDSLLHIAAARGDETGARAQLDAGVPVDLLDRDGLAPIHWALVRDGDAMLRLLLERGSPVDARSAEGATPLMNAVQRRSAEKVAFLLDRGADPNAADRRGFTALHRAAEMGEAAIVRLLLDRGASPHPEAQGHTPRSLAASRGEAAIVELLDSR